MYFISRRKNGKVGIVDTNDWVEEVYNEEDVLKFKLMGLEVYDESVQEEIIKFMWYYWSTVNDCGSSSTMYLVNEYVKGNSSMNSLRDEVGSSTLDIIKSLKSLYDSLKTKWVEFDLNSLSRTCKLYDRVASICVAESDYYRNDLSISQSAIKSGILTDVLHIVRAYHISIQAILEGVDSFVVKLEDFD